MVISWQHNHIRIDYYVIMLPRYCQMIIFIVEIKMSNIDIVIIDVSRLVGN